jgi:hypothetical protein
MVPRIVEDRRGIVEGPRKDTPGVRLPASLLSRICQSCGPMIGSVFGESSLQGAERGGRMVYVATDGDRPRRLGTSGRPGTSRRPGTSGPGGLSFGKIGPLVAAFAVASGAAAWIAGFNPSTMVLASVPPASDSLNFDDRFQPIPTRAPVNLSSRSLVKSWTAELELKLQHAKTELAQKLQSPDMQTAAVEDAKPATATNIPLPRSRPPELRVEAQNEAVAVTASTAPPERTVLQKLSDLIPTPKFSLASLGPDTGMYHDGPDLAALGYDKQTAVYDISAHAVYLPSGIRLEAHSGMGSLMDDPEHVSERMVGATPPAVYDLKPRERLFHGVYALRMIPQEANATLGRAGLLTHSFMLGPTGQSNGCVSIRNYDGFLKAYKDGEFTRLVVVPSLNDAGSASRVAASQPS